MMTAPLLLEQLRTSGIVVTLHEGRIRVQALEGYVTPELYQQLRDQQEQLLTYLQNTPPSTQSAERIVTVSPVGVTVTGTPSVMGAERVVTDAGKSATETSSVMGAERVVTDAGKSAIGSSSVVEGERVVTDAGESVIGLETPSMWEAERVVTDAGKSVIGSSSVVEGERVVTEVGESVIGSEVPPKRELPVRVSRPETFLGDVAELCEKLPRLGKTIALDLETTGLEARRNRVVSIAVGIPGDVTVLDLRPYYDLAEDERAAWRTAVQELLSLRGLTWVGQNLTFDWYFLDHYFDVRLDPVYDIMLVEQVLFGQDPGQGCERVSFSLRAIAARYQRLVSETVRTKLAVSKEERSWFVDLDQRPAAWSSPFPDEQLRYMVQDIEVPYRIAWLQGGALQRQNLEEVAQLENACLPVVAKMGFRGVLIDRERWQRVLQIKHARRQELEASLKEVLGGALAVVRQGRVRAFQDYQELLWTEQARLIRIYQNSPELSRSQSWEVYCAQEVERWQVSHPQVRKPSTTVGSSINLNSSTQVIEALAHLGIVVSSIREEVLEELAPRYPLVGQLLDWRKLQHFCCAFGENVLAYVQEDGRIHAHFAQIGAVSGRIVCRQPNLQQIPRKREQESEEEDLRRCFVAPPGYVLLKSDLSNIELRILADVSEDENMLRFFAEGRDLHAETAKLMFRLPPETNVREHLYNGVVVREIAKTINYGLSYGMGAQSLAERLAVSVDEARDLMQAYFDTYPGVSRWLRQAGATARAQGYAVSLAGRKRWLNFEGLDRGQCAALERVARNHPIQATNADILKCVLAILFDVLPTIEAYLILAVHDEIVLECPCEQIEEAVPLLKEILVEACRTYLKRVHLPEPEILVAEYWKKE